MLYLGVERGAAADEDDAVELRQIARRGAHAGEHGRTEIEIESAADGVAERVGLLVDFLEHEVVETALFRGGGIKGELGDLAGDRDVVEVADIDGIGADNGDVVVVQIDHALGVGDDGGSVGRDDGFSLADADNDGAAAAGGDDLVRLAGGQHGDAEGALDLVERVADGLEEVALVAIPYQMREDFGVGLGVEVMALPLKPGAEGAVVFDDSVVDERDVAGLVEVRVGVDLGWRAVGGPAGVGDAGGGALEKLGRPLGVGADEERDGRWLDSGIMEKHACSAQLFHCLWY